MVSNLSSTPSDVYSFLSVEASPPCDFVNDSPTLSPSPFKLYSSYDEMYLALEALVLAEKEIEWNKMDDYDRWSVSSRDPSALSYAKTLYRYGHPDIVGRKIRDKNGNLVMDLALATKIDEYLMWKDSVDHSDEDLFEEEPPTSPPPFVVPIDSDDSCFNAAVANALATADGLPTPAFMNLEDFCLFNRGLGPTAFPVKRALMLKNQAVELRRLAASSLPAHPLSGHPTVSLSDQLTTSHTSENPPPVVAPLNKISILNHSSQRPTPLAPPFSNTLLSPPHDSFPSSQYSLPLGTRTSFPPFFLPSVPPPEIPPAAPIGKSNSSNSNLKNPPSLTSVTSVNPPSHKLLLNHPPSPSETTHPVLVPKSWSSVVKEKTPRLPLHFVEPTSVDDNIHKLPFGSSRDGEEKWKNTIVGYFVGRRIPISNVERIATRLWKGFGLLDTTSLGGGMFFFRFSDGTACDNILRRCPWYMLGNTIFLKKWTRQVDVSRDDFCTIPVWCKFYNIPSVYWTEVGISGISSRIGIPLYTDEITASAKRLEFARVCMDMKVNSDFPSSFWVLSEFAEKFEISVSYEWKPVIASKTRPVAVPTCTPPNPPAKKPISTPPTSKSNFVPLIFNRPTDGLPSKTFRHNGNSPTNFYMPKPVLSRQPPRQPPTSPTAPLPLGVIKIPPLSTIHPHPLPIDNSFPLSTTPHINSLPCNPLPISEPLELSNRFSVLGEGTDIFVESLGEIFVDLSRFGNLENGCRDLVVYGESRGSSEVDVFGLDHALGNSVFKPSYD